MRTESKYRNYRKPSWAPPAWLFAPVWTALYILIAASFGYVGYLYFSGAISFLLLLPFVLNLIFNFLFTTIQFRWGNFELALVDILLVLATLVWALVGISVLVPWIPLINLPYLAWVLFASILQLTIVVLNRS